MRIKSQRETKRVSFYLSTSSYRRSIPRGHP